MPPVSDLSLSNRHSRRRIDLRLLREILHAVLAELRSSRHAGAALHCQVAIFLIGPRKSARLNREYLDHSGPTDIITFDYGPPERARPDSLWLRGELFICVDEAERQAREFATTWVSELTRYVIHGLLHLVGYDDREEADRKEMKRVEGRLLRRVSRQFDLSELDRGERGRP